MVACCAAGLMSPSAMDVPWSAPWITMLLEMRSPAWRAIACDASWPITTASSSSDFAMRSMPV